MNKLTLNRKAEKWQLPFFIFISTMMRKTPKFSKKSQNVLRSQHVFCENKTNLHLIVGTSEMLSLPPSLSYPKYENSLLNIINVEQNRDNRNHYEIFLQKPYNQAPLNSKQDPHCPPCSILSSLQPLLFFIRRQNIQNSSNIQIMHQPNQA